MSICKRYLLGCLHTEDSRIPRDPALDTEVSRSNVLRTTVPVWPLIYTASFLPKNWFTFQKGNSMDFYSTLLSRRELRHNLQEHFSLTHSTESFWKITICIKRCMFTIGIFCYIKGKFVQARGQLSIPFPWQLWLQFSESNVRFPSFSGRDKKECLLNCTLDVLVQYHTTLL